MSKMQLPIPDDWTEEIWECYQVRFPKSQDWTGLFLGNLSQWYKGRLWNADTGNIKAVQAIGQEIWTRNYPLTTCEQAQATTELIYLNYILDCLGIEPVDQLPENCEEIVNLFASLGDCGCNDENEECMASVTNIKCENGKLYMEKCCQWIEVCEISSITGNTTPETPEIEQTDWHCNIAGAYTEQIVISKLIGLSSVINGSMFGTDQEIVEIVKASAPYMYLDTTYLLYAVQAYRKDQATVFGEIVSIFGAPNEDTIRCAVYGAIEDAPLGTPEHTPTDTMLDNMYTIIANYPGLSQWTRYVVGYLLTAMSREYVKSAIGMYTAISYDCGCGTIELSPQSDFHGTDEWYLSEGIAGGAQSSSGNDIWPVVQWCIENSGGVPGYGIAFKIIATSAPGMVVFNNPTYPQACESDQDLRPDSGHSGTVLSVGQYIICDADVYGFLEEDAEQYILLENNLYGDAPGEGIWPSLNVGKVSMRSTVDHTAFTAYITDFRIVCCNADA